MKDGREERERMKGGERRRKVKEEKEAQTEAGGREDRGRAFFLLNHPKAKLEKEAKQRHSEKKGRKHDAELKGRPWFQCFIRKVPRLPAGHSIQESTKHQERPLPCSFSSWERQGWFLHVSTSTHAGVPGHQQTPSQPSIPDTDR